MKRSILTIVLGLGALTLAGCGDDTTGNSGGDGGGSGDAQPYRDDWREVVNQPFQVQDGDDILISELIIGNEGGDNFRNRGDVIVQYADTDRITVEMRKFTMVQGQGLADDDFDKLSIFATTGSLPSRPYALAPEDNCVDPAGQMQWPDGCRIAVFYDGQTQVDRSGADLRVTLPRDFIYSLVIETEDNDADSDYQNRGNVCVEGLPGSADISLSNGSAWVILDPSMSEMPECPPNLRTACEEANWDPDACDCLAQGFSFSQVKVATNDAQAADAIVDIPPGGDFWVGYSMRNDGQNLPGDDSPGALCEAVVEDSAGSVILNEGIDLGQSPNANQGSINYPGQPAVEGAGFSILLTSDTCAAPLGTEDPDNFAGVGNGPEQDSDERGNMTICSGCIRNTGCAELIPGL